MEPKSPRPPFRGNVTSPFLLHQFVDELDEDEDLEDMRERAISLCKCADRESLSAALDSLSLATNKKKEHFIPTTKLHESASSAMLRELAGAPAAVSLGLDLGGSLTKLVVAAPDRRGNDSLSVRVRIQSNDMWLHFASASTDELEEVLKGWGDSSTTATRSVVAAGGGAHKLRGKFRIALGIELEPFREMQSIVDGLLLLHELQVEEEVFRVKLQDMQETVSSWPNPLLPLLLVNVGSGVSCLLVAREGYARIGGTAIGGATFLGLARVLTSARTFDDAIALAEKGDASHVDTLVQDIYGDAGCVDLGLPPDLTAASFGKLSRDLKRSSTYSEPDICRALLEMVAQSCCVLARAHAAQLGCRQRIFFAGGFVDNNPLARATISYSLRSLGGRAHFLRHSDFLGALGAAAKCLSGGPKQKVSQLPPHNP